MRKIIVIEDLCGPASVGRGGHAMYVLQWLHALASQGDEIYFVEFLSETPLNEAIGYFRRVTDGWWNPRRTSLLIEATGKCLFGLSADQLKDVADKASAVITLAAHYRRAFFPIVDEVRPRILIEQDPGYTHLWATNDPRDIFGEHDIYFTVGSNVGTDRCSLPTHDIAWKHIWNPVVLDWWQTDSPTDPAHLFSTIGDWRGYGYLEFEGKLLGPKSEEFRKFIDVPSLAGEDVRVVLNIGEDDPDMPYLREHGWLVEDPSVVATPHLYRSFIQNSAGEFSCVKGGYAGTSCGWFSDRSACYLAAGKPVVMQSTGFADILPTQKGLFSVQASEEAAEVISMIRRDYSSHSTAARRIAEAEFDSQHIGGLVLETFK